jgi:hypothetical protein
VHKYNQLLADFATSHQLLSSLHLLYSARQGDFTPVQAQRLQGPDVLRSQGMRYAEKRCRKFAMGKVEYSPVVAATRLRGWLWQKIVRWKQGWRVSCNLLRRTAKKCGITDALHISLAEAQRRYEACNKDYAALKKRAPELRHEFLHGLSSNETGDVTPESQKAAQRQLSHERQHHDARHLRQVLGSAQGGAISRIEVVQGDVILEVTGQEDVECYTMEMCEAQFRLTENTPPMTAPLLGDLGFLGTTVVARQILAGTYEPPLRLMSIHDSSSWNYDLLPPLTRQTASHVKSLGRTSNTTGADPKSAPHPRFQASIMDITRRQHKVNSLVKYML